MEYYKNINEGYIVSIGTGKGEIVISEAEYNTILDLIRNKHMVPEGYDYRLREDLTWELYELPEPEDEEATIEDYENALAELGVK